MKKKVSIQQYSYYILYIISYGSKNFFESNKEFLKFDIYSEIAYYIFFVYISKQILLIKYSQQTVDSIVNNIILKNIEIEYEHMENQPNELYQELYDLHYSLYLSLNDAKFDIHNHDSLREMAKLFLKILELPTTENSILYLCISFSGFIQYHTQDILNKKFKLMEN